MQRRRWCGRRTAARERSRYVRKGKTYVTVAVSESFHGANSEQKLNFSQYMRQWMICRKCTLGPLDRYVAELSLVTKHKRELARSEIVSWFQWQATSCFVARQDARKLLFIEETYAWVTVTWCSDGVVFAGHEAGFDWALLPLGGRGHAHVLDNGPGWIPSAPGDGDAISGQSARRWW